jgi:hypothetical protein
MFVLYVEGQLETSLEERGEAGEREQLGDAIGGGTLCRTEGEAGGDRWISCGSG